MDRFPVARLQRLIDQYMELHGEPSIISTKVAAKAVSTSMNDCPLQGRPLENAIAASAVKHGHAVAFDLTEYGARQALMKFWKARNASGAHFGPT